MFRIGYLNDDFVYGETNQHPMYVISAFRCIRHWFKLVQMECYRIPLKAYNMLYDLYFKGKQNWVSDIRTCLCEYSFAYLWMN